MGRTSETSCSAEPSTDASAEQFGPWRIWFDPPPIPTRSCDWHYQHEDTDEDCPPWMNGSCATREDCLREIIEHYEDEQSNNALRVKELQGAISTLEKQQQTDRQTIAALASRAESTQ